MTSVFLDLLGDPAQLGLLRARGLVTADTVTAVAFADHRVPSEAELRRRCGFWRATAGRATGRRSTTARSEKKIWDGTAGAVAGAGLGGARSGKSERAELRLAGEPDVTYVATGPNGRGGDGRRPIPSGRRGWRRTGRGGRLVADGGDHGPGGGAGRGARGGADRRDRHLAGRGAGECGAWGGSAGWAARLAARTGGLIGAWRQTRGLRGRGQRRGRARRGAGNAGRAAVPGRAGAAEPGAGGRVARRPNWSWRGGSCRWSDGQISIRMTRTDATVITVR